MPDVLSMQMIDQIDISNAFSLEIVKDLITTVRDKEEQIAGKERRYNNLRSISDKWRQLCADEVAKNTAMREALDAYEKECTALENCERLLRHIRNCMYEFDFDVSTIDSDIWDAIDKCLEETRSII